MTAEAGECVQAAQPQPGISLSPSLAELAEDEDSFFSNAGKKDREQWVLEHWRAQSGKSHLPVTDGERPDFTIGRESVEIVEVLEPDRRRQDDVKSDASELRAGQRPSSRWVPELESVKSTGHDWILQQIDAKARKYGAAAATWTLVVYVNVTWADRIDWKAVKQELEAHPRPFQQVDALSPDGHRMVALFP